MHLAQLGFSVMFNGSHYKTLKCNNALKFVEDYSVCYVGKWIGIEMGKHQLGFLNIPDER